MQAENRGLNFQPGGPLRILLHMLLRCVNFRDLEIGLFEQYMSMLRFLTFNKMDDKFKQVIVEILGPDILQGH